MEGKTIPRRLKSLQPKLQFPGRMSLVKRPENVCKMSQVDECHERDLNTSLRYVLSSKPSEDQLVSYRQNNGTDDIAMNPPITPMKTTAMGTAAPRPSSMGFSTLSIRATMMHQTKNTTALVVLAIIKI